MRASVTFDTLGYTNTLKNSGIEQKQAEAITQATADALDQIVDIKNLATKSDIAGVKSEIKDAIVKMVFWMVGISLTQMSIILGIINYLLKK